MQVQAGIFFQRETAPRCFNATVDFARGSQQDARKVFGELSIEALLRSNYYVEVTLHASWNWNCRRSLWNGDQEAVYGYELATEKPVVHAKRFL